MLKSLGFLPARFSGIRLNSANCSIQFRNYVHSSDDEKLLCNSEVDKMSFFSSVVISFKLIHSVLFALKRFAYFTSARDFPTYCKPS